jgi:hypothetical protein
MSSIVASLAAVLAALAWATRVGSVSVPAAIGGAAALIAAAAILMLWRRRSVAGSTATVTVDVLLESVARWQREQWSAEEAARQVHDPWPLPVRWKVTARAEALMVSWGAVTGRPAAPPLPLEGTYDVVADGFAAPAGHHRTRPTHRRRHHLVHLPPPASSHRQDQPLRPANPHRAIERISCWST